MFSNKSKAGFIIYLFILFNFCAFNINAQMADTGAVSKSGSYSRTFGITAASISYINEMAAVSTDLKLPYLGLGHFVQQEWFAGSSFFAAELGMTGLANMMRNKVPSANWNLYPRYSNNLGYVNSKGLSAQGRAYNDYADIFDLLYYYTRLVDVYTSYRTAHRKNAHFNKVNMEDEGIISLFASPFKPRYLVNPWVFVPVILAGTGAYFSSESDKSLSDAEQITMFNSTSSGSGTLLKYGGIQALRYMFVAAGEEMLFRGVIQTELTERTKPLFAIGGSSLLFGLWHVPSQGIGGGLKTTLIGLYLGYRYNNNGYDLGEVIATHFWIDWIGSIIELIRDPRNARFVYEIKWKM